MNVLMVSSLRFSVLNVCRNIRILGWLICCLFPAIAEGQLVINEVCSANGSSFTDFEGDTPDYIELYNPGSTAESTEGLHLTDSGNEFKWPLPELEIGPGEYIVVACSGKDLTTPELHTNFGIDSDGETIRLTDEYGAVVDFVIVPELHSDNAYGRNSEGEFVYFLNTTPGEINPSESYNGYAPAPVFSRPGGFYDAPFQLTVQETAGETLFQTNNLYPQHDLNGSSISIDSTMSVTAVNFEDGKLPSRIVGATYFINEEHNMPVVALIADSLELFDEETGIYMLGPNADPEWPHFGGNIWNNQHILSWIEVYQEEEQVIAQLAESRMHGGQSARNQPQRPFRFIAKDRLGVERFYAQLQRQSHQTTYKKFVVRNGGSDYHRVHISDSFIERQVTKYGLDLEAKGSEPCVFYINGYYWGFMDIQRVIDDWFVWSVTEYEEGTPISILEDDSLVIKGDISSFDTMLEFVELNDMNVPENFAHAESLVDVSNFTDYIITETFWNNVDWPANNVKAWRPMVDGGKWRYILFDMDVSLSSFGFATEQNNGLQRFLDEFPDNKHYRLFNNLYANAEYRITFLNRYADLCNSAFSREAITSELRNHVALIWDEKDRHHGRWGSSRWFWETFWLYPRAYEFADKRTEIAFDQVRDGFDLDGHYELELNTAPAFAGTVSINSLDSLPHDWNGSYFNGIPIDITAHPAPGYQFSHWETKDGEVASTGSQRTVFNTDASTTELTAVFTDVNASQLFVWPNPSDGDVTISFDAQESGFAQVQLFDSRGAIIYESKVGVDLGTNLVQMNAIPAGSYVVRVTTKDMSFTETLISR
ncbi:CotH kinase family protein [Sanyastnella coralliicola]|uniref:CotH kinase family protein n=1 Tax=Sanyastnella coralliicola TaxID=3069118 RepID=UPI0027B90478|nr:CotH kinase family protein [Longitalea sp. SCSIO 12813]